MEESCLEANRSMTSLSHEDEELQGKNCCQVSVEIVCSMGFSAKQARTPKDSRRFQVFRSSKSLIPEMKHSRGTPDDAKQSFQGWEAKNQAGRLSSTSSKVLVPSKTPSRDPMAPSTDPSNKIKKEGMKQHNSTKSGGFFNFLANQRWQSNKLLTANSWVWLKEPCLSNNKGKTGQLDQ